MDKLGYIPFQRRGNTFVLRFQNGIEINVKLCEPNIKRFSENNLVEGLSQLFDFSAVEVIIDIVDTKEMKNLNTRFLGNRLGVCTVEALIDLLYKVRRKFDLDSVN